MLRTNVMLGIVKNREVKVGWAFQLVKTVNSFRKEEAEGTVRQERRAKGE